MKSRKGLVREDCGERCLQARRDVHRLLDRRLTPAGRRELLGHVKGCRGCFSILELARVMRAVVKSHVCAECCPSALERRVRKAVRSA